MMMLGKLQRPLGVAIKYNTTNNNAVICGVYRLHISGGGGGGAAGDGIAVLVGNAGGRATYSSSVVSHLSQARLLSFDQEVLGGGGGSTSSNPAGSGLQGRLRTAAGAQIAIAAGGSGGSGYGSQTPLSSIFPYEVGNEIGRGGRGGNASGGSGQSGKPRALWCQRVA